MKSNTKLRLPLAILLIVSLAAAAMPASALTITSYTAEIQDDGNAILTFNYDMTFVEYVGYYLNIANPGKLMKEEYDKHANMPGDVLSSDSKATSFKVYGYAAVSDDANGKTITTPSQSFQKAEAILKEHPVAKLTTFDLSPDITTVTFPDGYCETFYNELSIPSITHVVRR
ncbi:MAG: hypothetical protein II925_00545 [Methanomicrobium sp.]|nr:hypothetical protein [Methanomicrobium sp.]MBQ4415499.1 hypothetical protein [Methanomicrobium sp.]